MIPTQMPTARAVTRVRSATAMLCTYVVLGSVPIRPDRRLPSPSAASAPWMDWKSMARGRRQEMRWMAMQSPMVSMAPTNVSRTNAGSRLQKSGPRLRSRPGQARAGPPTQDASRTRPVS